MQHFYVKYRIGPWQRREEAVVTATSEEEARQFLKDLPLGITVDSVEPLRPDDLPHPLVSVIKSDRLGWNWPLGGLGHSARKS